MSYVKILIVLAAISTNAVCYALGLPVAEQDDGILGDHNHVVYNSYGTWNRPHHYYDGKNMQVRFGAGITSFIVMDKFDIHNSSGNFLEEYYRDYHGTIKSAGSYGIGFHYYLCKYLSIGVDVSADLLWCNIYDSISKSKVGSAKGVAFTLLPQIRLSYINRPKFRLYSAASLGFIAYYGNYPDTGSAYSEIYGAFDGSVELAWQLSPIGFEIGQNVFYFTELGIGYLYTAVRIGIGYRF